MTTLDANPMMQFKVFTTNGVRQLFKAGGPYGWKFVAML